MRFSIFLGIFFTAKKSIFNAENENPENSESSENSENSQKNLTAMRSYSCGWHFPGADQSVPGPGSRSVCAAAPGFGPRFGPRPRKVARFEGKIPVPGGHEAGENEPQAAFMTP